MEKYLAKIRENLGNLLRAGGALTTTASALNWYNGIKNEVVGKTISDLGQSLTGDICMPMTVYGLGELVNIVDEVHDAGKIGNEDDAGNFSKFADIISYPLRSAPMLSAPIALQTNNDFFYSILAPAAACVLGHGIKYVGNLFKKEQE